MNGFISWRVWSNNTQKKRILSSCFDEKYVHTSAFYFSVSCDCCGGQVRAGPCPHLFPAPQGHHSVPHASATPVPGSRENTGKHKFSSISQAVITPSVLCCLLHLVFHLPQSCQCHRQTENSEENLEMRSSGESWREDEEDKESEMVWMHKCCLSWKLEKGAGGAPNSQVSHLGAFCVWCFIACLTQGCCGKWPLYQIFGATFAEPLWARWPCPHYLLHEMLSYLGSRTVLFVCLVHPQSPWPPTPLVFLSEWSGWRRAVQQLASAFSGVWAVQVLIL